MRLWQKPPPGHGVDRATMSVRSERHDKVYHGQPGAADQDRRIPIDAGIGRTLPGIDVTGGTCSRRLIVTGGENGKVAADAAAVVDAYGDGRGRGVDGAPLSIDDPQPSRFSGRP